MSRKLQAHKLFTVLRMSSFFLALLATVLLSCEAQEYYVTPTTPPNSACPSGKPCHTLSFYASNTSAIFLGKENISLLFLDGEHDLTGQHLEIANVQSLTIAGLNGAFDIDNPQVRILSFSISVLNGSSFTIERISVSTGLLRVRDVQTVVCYQLVCYNEVSITVFAVLVDQVRVNRSRFFSSGLYLQWGYETALLIPEEDLSKAAVGTNSNLEVPTVEISDTVVTGPGFGGIALRLALSNKSIALKVHNCNITNTLSEGLYITVYQSKTDIFLSAEIQHCLITNNVYGVSLLAGPSNLVLLVSSCVFSDNTYSFRLLTEQTTVNATLQNSEFVVTGESAPRIYSLSFFGNQDDSTLLLKNVSFINSHFPFGVVVAYGPANVIIDSCYFDRNSAFLGGAILSAGINLVLLGDTIFSNNVADSGGAIFMSESTLWLGEDSNISFVNNTALSTGGAIAVLERASQTYFDTLVEIIRHRFFPKCLYQLGFNITEQPPRVLVHFKNNFARFGGDDVYGTGLSKSCSVTPDRTTKSYEIRDKIFDFHRPTLSSVASSSKRVCLCENGVPQCADINYIFQNLSVTPGEKFNLSVVLVGDDFGQIPGGVYAAPLLGLRSVLFDTGQDLQQVTSLTECTNLEYSVHARENEEVVFFLSTESVTSLTQRLSYISNVSFVREELLQATEDYKNTSAISLPLLRALVIITVNVLPCPLGFELNNSSLVCQCKEELQGYTSSCVVENGRGILYRNGTIWIGTTSTNTVIVNHLCPFGYCKQETIGVDLSFPDAQCALNHSGNLCGGCSPDLSLAIGSSECILCPDNNFVTLLLPFFALGIALVFFIKILDLTVTRGTINGLIFYANIVWVNQAIFFPNDSEQIDNVLLQILKVLKIFVAWLNLDFGIGNTCFSYGLDAYSKTALQFLFPVYVWTLAAVIIAVCQLSTRITKLVGKNSVAVLITLFLLGYIKMIRIIFSVFGVAHLVQFNPEYKVKWVWIVDGNVSYGQDIGFDFLSLVIFCVFCLVFLVPFTFFLLFAKHLHKLPLNVVRVKPILDSFIGQLKDKHQYWTGLTLLVRVLLVVIALSLLSVNPTIVLYSILLSSALLSALVLHVYKRLALSILEFLFIFKLVVISAAFLSTDDLQNRVIFSVVSIAIAFLLFMGIVVYHVILVVKKLGVKLKERLKNKSCSNSRSEESSVSVLNPSPRIVTTTVLELTESLLDDVPKSSLSLDIQPKNFTDLREDLLESIPVND